MTQQHHTVSTPEPSENTSALCSSPRSQQRPWNLDRNWAFRMKSLESGPNPGLQDVSMNRTPPSPKQATEGDALIPCPPAPSVTHGWSRPGSLRSGARQRFPVLAGESGGWCGARGGAPRGGLEPREAGGCKETAASGVTLVRRATRGDLRACGFCSFAPQLAASGLDPDARVRGHQRPSDRGDSGGLTHRALACLQLGARSVSGPRVRARRPHSGASKLQQKAPPAQSASSLSAPCPGSPQGAPLSRLLPKASSPLLSLVP